MTTCPESPDCVFPVDNNKSPVAPADDAAAVNTVTEPEPALVLAPLEICTLPPTSALRDAPADTATPPGWPTSPLPTTTLIEPALPPVASAVRKTIPPLDPPLDPPDVREITPPENPAAAVEPAEMLTVPPSPVPDTPTPTSIDPPMPDVAAPL
jgi:hypothetical protein